jgi:PAS domain S-box-containing protein
MPTGSSLDEQPHADAERGQAADFRIAEMAQARLAAIVESADDAIISKTLEGVITSWNKGAEHIFGYTADEVIGQPVTILFPPDHIDEEPAILARIRAGERIEHYETVRKRKDGTLLDISLTVSPIRAADGRIIGASKIARDITEQRAPSARSTRARRASASRWPPRAWATGTGTRRPTR